MKEQQPHLLRRFGALQATALNMTNMIGVGPFITIPLLMSALGGPQSMMGWLAGVVIVIADGMVWSELGAAMPGSGGSYVYLREGFGRESWGRLAAFLFIWQFIFSGPLEIASGYIGFAQYAEEVKEPGRVIPRSIIVSIIAVAFIYIAINMSIIGVVPWREFVPAADHAESRFIVSIFMEKIYGRGVASAFTLMVLWTAFGSV